MGTDLPDWGGNYNSAAFYPLSDLGEAAARLGAISTYDRRGSLIWQDKFDYGFGPYYTSTAGAGSAVSLITTPVHLPPFSASLFANGVAGGLAYIYRQFPIPATDKIGLSLFALPYTPNYELRFDLLIFTGALKKTAEISIKSSDNKLQVLTPSGLQDIVTGIPSLYGIFGYQFFKLVIDISTYKYERLLFLGQEYDLSATDLFSSADATAPNVTVRPVAATVDGANPTNLLVDAIQFTANEPANA